MTSSGRFSKLAHSRLCWGRPLAVPVVDVAELLQPATPQLTVSPVKDTPEGSNNTLLVQGYDSREQSDGEKEQAGQKQAYP